MLLRRDVRRDAPKCSSDGSAKSLDISSKTGGWALDVTWDFKSQVSASSTTPAWDYVITCAAGVSITAKFLLTFLRAGAIIVEHSKCASGGIGRLARFRF